MYGRQRAAQTGLNQNNKPVCSMTWAWHQPFLYLPARLWQATAALVPLCPGSACHRRPSLARHPSSINAARKHWQTLCTTACTARDIVRAAFRVRAACRRHPSVVPRAPSR
jgi:hypothetical protein